jgi:hypothetical protein
MPNPLSETVIDLYRRHAAYWDAARRGSDWNDRVWHRERSSRSWPAAAAFSTSAAAGVSLSRASWSTKDCA